MPLSEFDELVNLVSAVHDHASEALVLLDELNEMGSTGDIEADNVERVAEAMVELQLMLLALKGQQDRVLNDRE